MESAKTARRFRMWAIAAAGTLIGLLIVAIVGYQAIGEFQKKVAERDAVCPRVPDAQQDCIKFLAALRGKITAQGRPCAVIRKVGLKPDAITKKNGFDVSCASQDAKTLYRYEVEDVVDLPLIKVIP